MEKIKNIFNKYSQYIVVLVPIVWWFPGAILIGIVDGFCTESNLLRIICGYVFTVLPLWLGVFISDKKLLYFGAIFIWGSFWMVGLIAFYGMNCGIDWLQK